MSQQENKIVMNLLINFNDILVSQVKHYNNSKQIYSILYLLKNSENSKMNLNNKNNVIFDSDDTEGSDLSYESSVEIDQDNENQRQKNIEYFKQEMNRFFINNSELKNPNLIEKKQQSNQKNIWGLIASDIFQDTKKNGQMLSIEMFSKRLNLYRAKIERNEVIDIILKQQNTLLKKIQTQLQKQRKAQNSIHNTIQAKLKKQTGDITYYSWRKNKQLEFRIDKAQEKALSKNKNNSKAQITKNKEQIIKQSSIQNIDFQPKTDAGKSLLEQIKKCPDNLSAKKLIIHFLIKHRQNIIREFEAKPSLLQQSQKFYNQQSKQFVLLYPNPQIKKKLQNEFSKQKLEMKDLDEKSNEMYKSLNRILNSNLMNHWKNLQIKKI